VIWGGVGNDTFKYNSILESTNATGRDTIRDFQHSELDKIDLSAIDANVKANKPGDQAFKFIGHTSFHDKAGELRFHNGKVQGDVNGDGHADFAVKLIGVASMHGIDFFL